MFKSFKILIFLVPVCMVNASCDPRKHVVFPSKEVLDQAFRKVGLDHFVEKTKILDIVNAKLVPLGVAMRLEQEIYDYNKSMGNDPMMQVLVRMNQPHMLEKLLQADPAALVELEAAGIYKKPTKE